jgi:hypothetical protein
MRELNTLADVINQCGWSTTIDNHRALLAVSQDDKPRIKVWFEEGWWWAYVWCSDDYSFCCVGVTPCDALRDVRDFMKADGHEKWAQIDHVLYQHEDFLTAP